MAEREKPAASAAAPIRAPEGPPLTGVDRLVQGTVAEIDRMLDARQVVGEPLTFGATTVVPLVSVGFGFGAGGGGGTGGGGGGGGGGGVKPIAVLIVDASGVRLEPIPENPSALGRLGAALADAFERRRGGSGAED